MKPHNLNQVAVWLPMKGDELSIKTYTEYQFMHKGIIQGASTLNPVIRYAKNYYDGDHKFSLCIITQEKDTKVIEGFLDKVAEGITYNPDGPKFALTDIYFGA